MAFRILIADDNTPVRSALRRLLEGAGPWDVVEAEDGEEAVSRARESAFHLIILDLAMPKMDGIRAARVISALLPNIPIVMHTLHASRRVAVEAMKAGVRQVVPKEDSGKIITVVQELIGSQTESSTATSASTSSTSALVPPQPAVAEAAPIAPGADPIPAAMSSAASSEEKNDEPEHPTADATPPKEQ